MNYLINFLRLTNTAAIARVNDITTAKQNAIVQELLDNYHAAVTLQRFWRGFRTRNLRIYPGNHIVSYNLFNMIEIPCLPELETLTL